MKILAIETATMLGGVALMDDDLGLVAERRLNVKSTHSERLMPELSGMLELCGVSVSGLDAVAVSIGPGAFTGLRIGLAAAKGLAMSAGIKLVPVPTLEALALCLPLMDRPVCTMLDARRGQVYAALYNTSGGTPTEIMPPCAIRAGAFASRISGMSGIGNAHDVVFIGQGATVYREEITSNFKGKASFAPPNLNVPSPASVAALGLSLLRAGGLPDPIALGPLYIRKSEAELGQK